MRTLAIAATLAMATAVLLTPTEAEACGGFFCGQQPVDQQAERVVFAMNGDGTVTMISQISYTGASEDFAWVLPLSAVPAVESLETFPQLALTGLDAQTGPQFVMPTDCPGLFLEDAATGGTGGGPSRSGGGVEVHIRAEVGPYDVAVIESTDPMALYEWLRTEGYRVSSAMEPYIRVYTEEGMKFLALKLQDDADTSDITPFKFTLPGDVPSVPLRLTALAAEPEMGIAVFILGDMRYGPAGTWTEVDIDDSEIVWRPYTYPMETNWAALVARAVDAVEGRGFVTEYAGSTADYLDLLRSSAPSDPDQIAATEALLDLMGSHPYMTRLYTRLSPGEMTSDPSFRRTAGGDVDRLRQLERYVDGRDLCSMDGSTGYPTDSTTPCDFASCGAGGLCRVVAGSTATDPGVAGCACVPGATARTTFDPAGRPTVSCIDQRLSFMNPGDRESGDVLADPCVGFDCGAGSCVSMNMTPTCICDRGMVAVGSLAEDGTRLTNCVTPTESIPGDFYEWRLPDLPAQLPGGREVVVPPARTLGGGGCSSTGSPAPAALAFFALVGLFAIRRRK